MDAAQIVDVVSDFVTLRKAGVNYKGLCPFHDDRTPSFVVSPSKGLCKCFACGKGGNAVHFIMEHEQLSYPDALRYLARKYNIEIKERELTEEEKQAQDERESMVRRQRMGMPVFSRPALQHSRRTSHRNDLFPFTRLPGRYHKKIPVRIQSFAKRRLVPAKRKPKVTKKSSCSLPAYVTNVTTDNYKTAFSGVSFFRYTR